MDTSSPIALSLLDEDAMEIVRALRRQFSGSPERTVFLVRAMNALAELPPVTEDLVWRGLAAGSNVELLRLWVAQDGNGASPRTRAGARLAERRAEGARALQEWLQEEGGPLTAEEIADRLGITRQAVNNRRKESKLLALQEGREGRGYLYPSWQLAPAALGQTSRVLDGLEPALQALRALPPAMTLQFFLSPSPELEGRRPLDLLREARPAPVLRAARLFGRQGAQ